MTFWQRERRDCPGDSAPSPPSVFPSAFEAAPDKGQGKKRGNAKTPRNLTISGGSKPRYLFWLHDMAGDEGFEPSQTESESVVLPLHNSAIC